MRTFVFNKIVRNGILADIERLGGSAVSRKLVGKERVTALVEKFPEELNELLDAAPEKRPAEIADLEDLIEEMREAWDVSPAEIKAARAKRNAIVGGFSEGIYVETITIPDDDPWVNYYASRPERFPEITS